MKKSRRMAKAAVKRIFLCPGARKRCPARQSEAARRHAMGAAVREAVEKAVARAVERGVAQALARFSAQAAEKDGAHAADIRRTRVYPPTGDEGLPGHYLSGLV